HNNSGTWNNETTTSFSGAWVNDSIVLNATNSLVIGWKFFANDSSNNWNVSAIYTLTTNNTAPTIDSYNISNTTWSESTEINISINENDTHTFNVTASDISGDQLWYEWLLDGVLQDSTAQWDWNIGWQESGLYNITVVVNDTSNIIDKQEWNVTIANVYAPPEYSIGNQTNETLHNHSAWFALNWTSDSGLSYFILSTNNTGTWSNGTTTAFTDSWSNDSLVLNNSYGSIVG
ncbi:unnamed protein product, partial [marine sediment metagenome]